MKIAVLLPFLLNAASVQQFDADAATALMNHLVGRWTMTGTLTWRLTIDDVTDGKADRFGDMMLTRNTRK
jgi:hypothetical protein